MRRVKRGPVEKLPKKIGRPRRPAIAAYEFGLLVERELQPYEKLETVFVKIQRRDPERWKSMRTMYRLWREYRADQRLRAKVANQIRELAEIRERVGRGNSFLLDRAIETGISCLAMTPPQQPDWLNKSNRRR
jgi:hypothetical protein